MPNIAAGLGLQIRRLREQRGWTLTGFAERCGIAKSTLSTLEAGEGNPTVETLWTIASALEVPFSVLLDSEGTHGAGTACARDQGSVVRLVERRTGPPTIEVYAVDYAAGYRRQAPAHPPGVREQVTVLEGTMLVGDPRRPRFLRAGESHSFRADRPHLYAALEGPSRAHVLVQYPEQKALQGPFVLALDWPQREEEWEGVRAATDRLLIEVANGIGARLVRFRNCKLPAEQALKVLAEQIERRRDGFSWPVHAVAGHDVEGPYVAVSPLRYTRAFACVHEDATPTLLSEAVKLARWSEAPSRPLDEGTRRQLRQQAASDSWILSSLAAEVLTQRGELTLPSPLRQRARRRLAAPAAGGDGGFSSRIDVDDNDAFELLHPAYARQVVAMAQDVQQFLPAYAGRDARSALDVGTGPGVPLLMLQELLPAQRFIAIEPDPKAFAYLQHNLRGHPNVQALQADFLKADLAPQSCDLITSVGASHRFNTAFMLQQAMRLLRPAGVLVIADEFLPPFAQLAQRNLALVRHHAAYLLAAMAWIGREPLSTLPAEAWAGYRRFQDSLCLALLDAEAGRETAAVQRCRELLLEWRNTDRPEAPEHPVAAYMRFFCLELQAMVAGFDYEIERKTHPKRFLELACLAGFELLRHRRVFATAGHDDWDGGTHVFALRRPPEG